MSYGMELGGAGGSDMMMSSSALSPAGGALGTQSGGGLCIFGCTALLSGIAVLAALCEYDLSQEAAFFAVTGLGGLCFAKCQYKRVAEEKAIREGHGWASTIPQGPPPQGPPQGGPFEGWARSSDGHADESVADLVRKALRPVRQIFNDPQWSSASEPSNGSGNKKKRSPVHKPTPKKE